MLPGILALRAAALKKHANATKKVSRLRAKGAEIAGTELDVRRAWDNVKRYNSKQLQAYMEQLDQFNLRTNRIAATKDGQIIPRKEWNEYLRTERKYNAAVRKAESKINDLRPPGSGLTLAEREETRKKAKGTANTENTIWAETRRDPRFVKDAASLGKLKEQLARRLDPVWRSSQIGSQRKSANTMMDGLGASDLKEQVSALTDEQFDVLWSKTRFRETLLEKYHSSGESKGNATISSDDLSDSYELVEWASGLFIETQKE